jgi:hypothetical protein
MERRLFLVGLPLLVAAVACESDKDHHHRDDPVTPAPTPVPEPTPKTHEFEFRVNGTVSGQVDISMTNTAEGSTLIRSDLPWFVTVRSVRTFMFLSLEAAAIGEGKLTVQIFVDGQLFREATADGFDPSASISGQWAE